MIKWFFKARLSFWDIGVISTATTFYRNELWWGAASIFVLGGLISTVMRPKP